jgi:hypothetical protein
MNVRAHAAMMEDPETFQCSSAFWISCSDVMTPPSDDDSARGQAVKVCEGSVIWTGQSGGVDESWIPRAF